MKFKYKTFEIEVNEFDYWSIYNSLYDYMLESRQDDYDSYMNEYKEYYESVAEEQRAEYGTRYDVEFALSWARENYERNIKQESLWIVSRWEEQFNSISRPKTTRKRNFGKRNSITQKN